MATSTTPPDRGATGYRSHPRGDELPRPSNPRAEPVAAGRSPSCIASGTAVSVAPNGPSTNSSASRSTPRRSSPACCLGDPRARTTSERSASTARRRARAPPAEQTCAPCAARHAQWALRRPSLPLRRTAPDGGKHVHGPPSRLHPSRGVRSLPGPTPCAVRGDRGVPAAGRPRRVGEYGTRGGRGIAPVPHAPQPVSHHLQRPRLRPARATGTGGRAREPGAAPTSSSSERRLTCAVEANRSCSRRSPSCADGRARGDRRRRARPTTPRGTRREPRRPDQTIFTGWRDQVADLVQAFNAFCMPSSPGESFGNSAVEAMALGVPTIIFADGGGLLEHVLDSETGFVVGDAHELAAVLRRLDRRPRAGRGDRAAGAGFR